jgi:phosphate transport system protein
VKIHLDREIEKLNQKLLQLSALVEETLIKAVDSFINKDLSLAQVIKEGDNAIDDLEVEIEEECLKILALYQPVATDLRFIVASLKINNDLERIGDQAANISSRAVKLIELEPVAPPYDIRKITSHVQKMVRDSINSLIQQDAQMARDVLSADNLVDREYKNVFSNLHSRITENTAHTQQMILYLSVMRHLERIADYSTNIAEDVIYLAEGKIVRHGRLESI